MTIVSSASLSTQTLILEKTLYIIDFDLIVVDF